MTPHFEADFGSFAASAVSIAARSSGVQRSSASTQSTQSPRGLFERPVLLRDVAGPLVVQHAGRVLARDLDGAVAAAGVDHHDLVAPREALEAGADVALFVDADHRGRDRRPRRSRRVAHARTRSTLSTPRTRSISFITPVSARRSVTQRSNSGWQSGRRSGADARGADVDVGARDRLRDLREHAGLVHRHGAHAHQARLRGLRLPLHVDAALGVEREGVLAVLHVHGDAATARDEADHVVARQRLAAVARSAPARPRCRRRGCRCWAASRARGRRSRRRRFGAGVGLRRRVAAQLGDDRERREAPVADRGEEVVRRTRDLVPGQLVERAALEQPREREARAAQLALEDVATELAAARLLGDADRVADLRCAPCPRRRTRASPCAGTATRW